MRKLFLLILILAGGAWGNIALVQKDTVRFVNDSTKSISKAFGSNVTAGNLVVVTTDRQGSDYNASISSSGTATMSAWTEDTLYYVAGNVVATSAIYSAVVRGTGSLTIKDSVNGDWYFPIMSISEWSGADTSATRVRGKAVGGNTTGAPTTGTVNSVAGGLFVGTFASDGTGAITKGADFTNLVQVFDSSGGAAEYRIVTSGTTDAADWVAPTSGEGWNACMVVYQGAPPTISVHPASITRCVGASAAFSVTASGTGTLHYQWERKHGSWSNVGADAASYSWTAAAADNGDSARVTVTDDNGSTLSNRAYLTVTQPPTITYHYLIDTVGNSGRYGHVTGGGAADSTKISGWPTTFSMLSYTTKDTVQYGPLPTKITKGGYAITRYNCSGTTITYDSVFVDGPNAVFAGSPQLDTVGKTISALDPSSRAEADSFTALSLPAGLLIIHSGSTRGRISGIPTAVSDATNYKIYVWRKDIKADSGYVNIRVVKGVYDWLLDGDSNMADGSHGSPPHSSWMGDALLAVLGGTSLLTATSGYKTADVLAAIDATLTNNTFTKYALHVGTNDIYYLTNEERIGLGTQSFESALATYSANIATIIGKIRTVGMTPYIIGIPPDWTGQTSLYVFPAQSSYAKMFNACLREFCVVNQIVYADVYPWVCDVAQTDYRVDQFASTLYADPVHYNQAGCTLVGTMAGNATVPTRTTYTGISGGHSWQSCSLIGNASISANADFGSLVCPGIGDGVNGYCEAYGKSFSDDLKCTVTAYGDGAKVDVYMRCSDRNIVRDFTSVPWQKTNVLYTHGSPFVQWRIVAKEAATITHVGLEYQIQ